MKTLSILALLILSCTPALKAQEAPVKTIPGVAIDERWDVDWKVMQVSPDGHDVLLQQWGKSHILYLQEGRIVTLEPYLPMLDAYPRFSPDHSLMYEASPGLGDGRSTWSRLNFTPVPEFKSYVVAIGRLTDRKPLKVFADTNFIMGVNKQNQLIVSTAWTRDQKLAGLKGLRLLDPRTYKVLKQLRTDTIYNNTAPDPMWHPGFHFNSNYTALIATRFFSGEYVAIDIYPFGSDSVITGGIIKQQIWDFPMADEHCIYTPDKDTLLVYSMHTGRLLHKTVYATSLPKPEWCYRRCLYTIAGNGHLYRYDREQVTVYEEEVTPEALRTVKTYPLHFDPSHPFPSGNQRYQMAACAGPSLHIIPRIRQNESGPDNEGYVMDLTSGKMTLRIAPFYNIGAAQLEKEAKYQAESRAYYAKVEADRKAAKEKEASDATAEKAADCQRIINEAKMKQGTALPIGALVYKRGSGSCRNGYAIWGFDCDTRHFTAIGLNGYDANASNLDYSLCETGPYIICPACGGHPTSTRSQYVKDDAWHQTNFNVYKSDPNAVKQVQVTTTCSRCGGKGVVKQ